MRTIELQDASIVEELLVFNGAHQGGFASKGFTLELPTLIGSSGSYLIELETALRGLLRSLDPSSRIQFNWSTDSNFRPELERFK